MKRDKNIQIPLTLFMSIAKYFMLDSRDLAIEEQIKKGIKNKVDAYNRHELYTQYKSSSLPAETKEKARQEYLDAAGIPNSFRWPEGSQ